MSKTIESLLADLVMVTNKTIPGQVTHKFEETKAAIKQLGYEAIGEDEPTAVDLSRGIGGYRHDAKGRNELRQEIRDRWEKLMG